MEIAIIVAGGTGSRMKSEIPKQFIEIGGIPLLMHTINSFSNYSKDLEIILVLPEDWIEYWNELIQKYGFKVPHKIIPGGKTRTDSVRNGLAHVREKDIVAIHDGVRPFISSKVIAGAYEMASSLGNAIVSVKLKDSIRITEIGVPSKSVDRSKYRLIQTPQVFLGKLIKQAYEQIGSSGEEFTDDASVVEYFGQQIFLFNGDYSNIKITTPEDLLVAEAIVKMKSKPGLTG